MKAPSLNYFVGVDLVCLGNRIVKGIL